MYNTSILGTSHHEKGTSVSPTHQSGELGSPFASNSPTAKQFPHFDFHSPISTSKQFPKIESPNLPSNLFPKFEPKSQISSAHIISQQITHSKNFSVINNSISPNVTDKITPNGHKSQPPMIENQGFEKGKNGKKKKKMMMYDFEIFNQDGSISGDWEENLRRKSEANSQKNAYLFVTSISPKHDFGKKTEDFDKLFEHPTSMTIKLESIRSKDNIKDIHSGGFTPGSPNSNKIGGSVLAQSLSRRWNE
jgi:hypothetical protein